MVIYCFVILVGSCDCLDYLYLLICVDIVGISLKLWNVWKDCLLVDLYFVIWCVLCEGLEYLVLVVECVVEVCDSVCVLVCE